MIPGVFFIEGDMMFIILLILSLPLVITGKMTLLGGRTIQGKMVRIFGIGLFLLSMATSYFPESLSLSLFLIAMVFYLSAYFFTVGKEPTKDEKRLCGFKSEKDELRTYSISLQGIMAFLIVLGLVLCCTMLILKLTV